MNIEKYKKSSELAKIEEQVSGKLSLYDVVRLPNIQLAENNKELLIEMLIELNNFLNIQRKMNEGQIADTVKMLFEEYPRMSLQEYAIFFRNIKSGRYGSLYESIDGTKIMVFMKDFYNEVCNEYFQFKEEDHMNIKLMEGHRDIGIYNEYKTKNNDSRKN